MSLTARSSIAFLLLAVPVAVELVVHSFGDTGDLVFAVSQVLGWLLVASVVRDGGGRHTTGAGRSGRVGWRLVLVGAGLQSLFGLVYGATTAIAGAPMEASFALFTLGFLAVLVGGLMWGRWLLRVNGPRLAAWGVIATAVLGFLAIAVGMDPFHDVFLLSSYAAWVLVGQGLELQAGGAEPVNASARQAVVD